MKQKMYEKKSSIERQEKLSEMSDGVEAFTYQKEFSKSELTEIKDQVAKSLIELSDLEDELTDIKKEYGDKISPYKTELKRLTQFLKVGSRMVTEDCFKLIEVDSQETGFYNEDGILVFSRQCSPDEMQLKIV